MKSETEKEKMKENYMREIQILRESTENNEQKEETVQRIIQEQVSTIENSVFEEIDEVLTRKIEEEMV